MATGRISKSKTVPKCDPQSRHDSGKHYLAAIIAGLLMSCTTQSLPMVPMSEQLVEHVTQIVEERPTRRQFKGGVVSLQDYAVTCAGCVELRDIKFQGTLVADGTPVFIYMSGAGTYQYQAQGAAVKANVGAARLVCWGSTAAIAESCTSDNQIGHVMNPPAVQVLVK